MGTERLWISRWVVLVVLSLAIAALKADTLYLRDGQAVDGTYLGGTAQIVRFRVNGLIKTYQISEIQDIQFGTLSGSAGSRRISRDCKSASPRSGGRRKS